MFIWPKLGQNPSQIDVRTFARVKNLIWGWNSPELSCIFVAVQNRRWFCNLKFLFLFTFPEYLTRVLPPVLAMECPTVIKKIVFTSPEAMVEFSGGKIKSRPLSKTLLTYVNLYSSERSRERPLLFLRLQITLKRYAKNVKPNLSQSKLSANFESRNL